MSSFINFNNKVSSTETVYSAEVIKIALLESETKNSNKVNKIVEAIKEPITLNEALDFFTDKLRAVKSLSNAITTINEGRVKQFEMDYTSMVKDIKKGYGWIDPDYVAQTWDNSSDSIDFELVRDEIFDRLIAAGLLAHADDNDPEKAGKKIKSAKDLYVMESEEEVEEISETRYYAFHKGQKHEIEADSLWGAKQKAITDLKVKKKDVGMLAIVLADSHDDFSKGKNSEFAFEGETTVYESATAQLADEEKFELYTATLKNKTATLKATTTTKTWDDGVPVLKYLARGKGKPTQVNINGSFEVAHDVARGWFYFTDGRKWFGLHIEDGYGDSTDLPFNMEVKESVVTEAMFSVKDLKEPGLIWWYNKKGDKAQVTKIDKIDNLNFPRAKDAPEGFNISWGMGTLDDWFEKTGEKNPKVGEVYDITESVVTEAVKYIDTDKTVDGNKLVKFWKPISRDKWIKANKDKVISVPNSTVINTDQGREVGSSRGPYYLIIKESVTEAKFVKDFNRDVLNAKTKEEVLELYPNAEFFIGKSDHFFGELDGNLFFKAYYTKGQKEFEIKSVYSEKGSNYVHLYNESIVTEAKFDKKSLMKAMKKDDGFIQLGNGQEYIIYAYDNGNDDNDAMWGDKTIFALDQDGEEHEVKYSDIVSYNESVVTESKEAAEAEAILNDLLDERGGDMEELHGMEMEDALDTVEAYGHKGSKAKKIAQELVSMTNESAITEGRSVNKIQKEWNQVTTDMIQKVQAWKAAEGDRKAEILEELKALTARKKALESELDVAVAGKDKDVQLVVSEGNAFGAARAKAIANGEKTFKVEGEEYDVEGVDKEDKENAEEFVSERNAFLAARAKAIQEESDEFEFNGKTYPVIYEGNAFGAARAEAIANGASTFTVDGEEYDVEDVDAEDKKNAEEFVEESEILWDALIEKFAITNEDLRSDIKKYIKTNKKEIDALADQDDWDRIYSMLMTDFEVEEDDDKAADELKTIFNIVY